MTDKQKRDYSVISRKPEEHILKCIGNELFCYNFIVLHGSVLKDKIYAVYYLLISCLYPKL